MTSTREIALRIGMVEEAIQRGEIPFIPFAHFRKHIESIVSGQVPSTPFTTSFDLFNEKQDVPRLHLLVPKLIDQELLNLTYFEEGK